MQCYVFFLHTTADEIPLRWRQITGGELLHTEQALPYVLCTQIASQCRSQNSFVASSPCAHNVLLRHLRSIRAISCGKTLSALVKKMRSRGHQDERPSCPAHVAGAFVAATATVTLSLLYLGRPAVFRPVPLSPRMAAAPSSPRWLHMARLLFVAIRAAQGGYELDRPQISVVYFKFSQQFF